jgi:hypothetical protein
MNLKDFRSEARKQKLEKYKNTFFNDSVAIESNYAVLGGDNHTDIEEAIKRVYEEFKVKMKEFMISDKFLNSKEEQKIYKKDPVNTVITFSIYILIELLKKDGYLRKKIGKVEENKLYNDSYVYDDNGILIFCNTYSVLALCLNLVNEKSSNVDKYKNIDLLSKEVNLEKKIAIKREIYDARINANPNELINKISKKTKTEINKEEFLSRKLASGQTVAELFQEVQKEYAMKSADDLIFEIKIIAFAKTILKAQNPTTIYPNYSVKARIKQDDIWKFFLKRDKTGRYPTYAKHQILKKLWSKQNNLISFVDIIENNPTLISRKLYDFDEILLLNKSEYFISINLSPINLLLKNYIYIDLNELEEIDNYINEYWKETHKNNHKNFKKIVKRIETNQFFRAVPIKFYILLKYKYHKGNNYKNKNTGYIGNYWCISDEKLNIGLGNIDFEIVKTLRINHYIRNNHKNTEIFKTIRNYILGCTFYCAKKLKWINSFPKINNKKQEWEFNLNASYFDIEAKSQNLKIFKT